jgi:sugar phosphate isomerase/epimerase
VNFDPANMILYGMGDPVAAVRVLAPWIRQVHIKDALPAGRAGEWGQEVQAGTGAVDWPAFIGALRDLGRPLDLVIEREAGAARSGDVRVALDRLRTWCGADLA